MNLSSNTSRTPVKSTIFTNFLVFPKRLQALHGAVAYEPLKRSLSPVDHISLAYTTRLDGCIQLMCDLNA